MEPAKPISRVKVIMVVGSYMLAALVMVFVNKAVLNSTPKLPYSFLFVQTSMSVILIKILSKLFPESVNLGNQLFEDLKVVAPLSVIGLGGLVFNTLCLRNVDTTFFQIARGLLLPMTIIVSSVVMRRMPRSNVILAAAIVFIGFMIGVSPTSIPQAASFSTAARISAQLRNVASLGLIYGIISSLLAACHAVARKYMVGKLPNIVQVSFGGNIVCSALLIPLIILNGELKILHEVFIVRANTDWEVFLAGGAITGVFGLFLSLAGLLSIKVTSPVTHMFSSAARSVLQTLLGVTIFGDAITTDRLSSITTIIIGTLYFTWIQNARAASTPPSHELTTKPVPEKNSEKYRD